MSDRDNLDDNDDSAQLDAADTLDDRGVSDPLDEGYSPCLLYTSPSPRDRS